MAGQPWAVPAGPATLAAERWPGSGPTVLALHAGVADRRSWAQVAERLEGRVAMTAYDRRGYGETPPATGPFSHLDDLGAVLDALGPDPVWLVGNSMGGGLALDAALTRPVAGLVLIAPGVSGAPEPEPDETTRAFVTRLDAAEKAGDLDEVNRLETWFWLDGPGQPEGRVSGPARELALAMNAIPLAHAAPERAGESGIDTWSRLGEIQVPVTVACGDLDAPWLVEASRQVADQLPRGRYRPLPGVAHLPSVERPELIADLIAESVGA